MGPFSERDLQVLSAFADGRIDISEEAYLQQASLAVKVIHDHEFATPPASFREYRLRVQYLAEQKVGRLVRQEQAREDAAFRKALERVQ